MAPETSICTSDPIAFLSGIEDLLTQGHYKQVQSKVQAVLAEKGVTTSFLVNVLKESIVPGSMHEEPRTWSASIPFMLLEVIQHQGQHKQQNEQHHQQQRQDPQPSSSAAPPNISDPEADAASPPSVPALDSPLSLLSLCCTNGQAKLGLRVAQGFNIQWEQVVAAGLQDEVVECVRELMVEDTGALPVAIGWLMVFEVGGHDDALAAVQGPAGAQMVQLLCDRVCGHLCVTLLHAFPRPTIVFYR